MSRATLSIRIACGLCALVLGALLGLMLKPDGHDLVSVDQVGRDLGTPSPGRTAGEPQVSSGRSVQEPGPDFDIDLGDTASASASADAPEAVASTEGLPDAGPDAGSTDDAEAAEPAAPAEPAAATPAPTTTTTAPDSQVGGAARPGTVPTTAAPAAAPPATNAPDTTAAPAPVKPQDTLAITEFTDWPIRNTSLDTRTQFVDTPASQINWQQFTEASDRSIALGSTTPTKHLGQFRTQCSFSHFAYDDPLAVPGQPGAAHLHMFFGNTEANANSTYQTMRDNGSSTCNGLEGNRTGYWVPAVFDASGNARIPSRIEVYYKSHDRSFDHVQKPPEGLGMIAGNASTNPHIEWACQETGAQGQNLNRPVQQRQNTIPRCSGTATLLAHIKFPQCLSGSVNANTGNATNQMSYPTRGYFTDSCPAGTVYITAIEYFIAWAPDNHDGQTDQWWLSSDVRPDKTLVANGSTLHGDWFGGWNPELMDQIHANCVGRLAECSWDLVADNQRLTQVEHFGGRHAAAYNGRRAIPASELSAALCPSDDFSQAVDAANCETRQGQTRTLNTTLQPGVSSESDALAASHTENPSFFCSLHPPVSS